jgi:DNA-binding HxlR family transcriptional regulator
LEQEPIGFNTLHRSIEDISRKVLSESLSDLESNGIVNRETVDTNPARVQYTLTETGRSLKSVIDAMEEWGASHLDELPT